MCIPWVEVCRNGCTQGNSSSFFEKKELSWVQLTCLPCLALPFYLVAKLLRHAFFASERLNTCEKCQQFCKRYVQCCPQKKHAIQVIRLDPFALSSQFLAVCVETVIFFYSIVFLFFSHSGVLILQLCTVNVALSPFTLPPLPSVLQTSKRSEEEVAGRTDGNVKVIFPGSMTEPLTQSSTTFRPGDYVIVKVRVYGYILVAQVQRQYTWGLYYLEP